MSLDVYLYIDVDVGVADKKRIELFNANITHNLTDMAEEAGLYFYIWRPEEFNLKYAKNIVQPMEDGLRLLKSDPIRFKKLSSPNGWGTYEQFIPWVEEYLEACKEYPKALVEVSR